MILNIFIIFLALSVAFIITGYFTQAPPIQMIGYGFLFILGMIIMIGGLQYESGYRETYIYGDNFSDYHYEDYNGTTKYDDMQLFHLNNTITYDDFDDEIIQNINLSHFFGFFLSLGAVLGFITVLFNLGKLKRKPTEYDPDYDEKE